MRFLFQGDFFRIFIFKKSVRIFLHPIVYPNIDACKISVLISIFAALIITYNKIFIYKAIVVFLRVCVSQSLL